MNFKHGNFGALKRYKSTEDDRRIWLHVPSGTPWSTSSDTHQVVEIQNQTSTKMYKRIFWVDIRDQNITICCSFHQHAHWYYQIEVFHVKILFTKEINF